VVSDYFSELLPAVGVKNSNPNQKSKFENHDPSPLVSGQRIL